MLNKINKAMQVLMLALVFTLICLALKRPCPQIYSNWDEVGYNSLAISLLKNGTYKVDAEPDGILPTDGYFAGNPLLYPYLSYISLKIFGVSRVAMRLPSALAFLGAGILLLLSAKAIKQEGFHGTTVMLTFLLCPFLIYSGCIARPEMIGAFAVYLSAYACLKTNGVKSKGKWFLLSFSGFAASLAIWNHPLFACVACLPLLLTHEVGRFESFNAIAKVIIFWLLGAGFAFFILSIFIIVPHWEAWKEQFPLNSASVSSYNSAIRYVPQPASVLELLQHLKARFSTFGYQYIAWYACIPIICFLILKPTKRFFLGFFLLSLWMLLIEWKTAIEVSYVVQFGVGVPLLVLLCEPRQLKWLKSAPAILMASLIGLVLVIMHSFWVLEPSPASRNFADQEKKLTEQINKLPGHGTIVGPVAAALPAWQSGRRYFLPHPALFMAVKDIQTRYQFLVKQQAEWVVADDLKLNIMGR